MRHGKLGILPKTATPPTETQWEIIPFRLVLPKSNLSIEERQEVLHLCDDWPTDCYSDEEVLGCTRRFLAAPTSEELDEARSWIAGDQIKNLAVKLFDCWGSLR